MKHFIKVFSIAFLCFMLAFGAGMFTYVKFANTADSADANDSNPDKDSEQELIEDEGLSPFERAVKHSERVNVVLLGLEGPRTDTIMFASFDPETNKVDMISIPRDTYYADKGYPQGDQKKINAKYGRSGVEGTKKAIENILKVPVHNYVSVTYNGVESIVDALGGVEVNVPFHMVYQDTTPGRKPLYINIPKGRQTLDGKNAVKFLRYRKSNDGRSGYPDGDLGRIKAQQKFVQSAIKKAFSFRIISVVNATLDHVKTDMSKTDILKYGTSAWGINMDDISMHTLPGRPAYRNGLSYFFHDPSGVRDLVEDIYGVKDETEKTPKEEEKETRE